MADLAALVIKLSAEGSEKVVGQMRSIQSTSRMTVGVLEEIRKSLNRIEKTGLTGLRNEFNKTKTSASQLADQVKKQQATITDLQNKLKGLESGQKGVTGATRDGTAAIEKQGKGIRNLIPHVASVTIAYMAMRKAVRAVMDTLTTGADFEHQMALVGGIARANAQEFEMLSKAARKAGEETVWMATEAAGALRYLSMAGFNAQESVAALGGVLNLALIGELDLSRATDIATDTLRAFGLAATDLNKVVDVFTGTITRSNTNIEMMGQAMKYVAPVASKLGYTVEEVSAMIGILSQSGIKSGIAGRALRMSFLRSADAAKALGIASTNLIDILKELNSRHLTPTELTETLKDLFGLRSTPALLTLMQGMDQLEQFIDTLNNAGGETDRFIERLDTTTVAWKKLISVIKDVAIEAFNTYSDALKSSIDALRDYIAGHKDDIIGFFGDIGKGAKELAPVAEAINNIIAALDKLANYGTSGGLSTARMVSTGVLLRWLFGKWGPGVALATIEVFENSLQEISNMIFEEKKTVKGPVDKLMELVDMINQIPVEVQEAIKWWDEFIFGLDKSAAAAEVNNAVVSRATVEFLELYDNVVKIAESIGKLTLENNENAISWEEIELRIIRTKAAITAYDNVIQELKGKKWYELIPEADYDEAIEKLKARDAYEAKVIEELKSLWGDFYTVNRKEFDKLVEHRVKKWEEEYDEREKIQKDLFSLEADFCSKLTDIFAELKDAQHKIAVEKEIQRVLEEYNIRINYTKAGSAEELELQKEKYDAALEIAKEGLKKQEDAERWHNKIKNELLKDDTVAQLQKLDAEYEATKSVLGDTLKLWQAYMDKRSKILAAGYKGEANAIQKVMEEQDEYILKGKKWVDQEEEKFRKDKLSAMKSLYEDLEEISGNYFEAQVELIELEYEEYLKSLGLKLDKMEDWTEKDKALYDALVKWKINKTAEEYIKLLKSTGDYIDGVKAYLLRAKIDWQDYYKKIGDYAYNTMETMSDGLKGMLSSALQGEYEEVKDKWDNLLDDMLDEFTDFVADLIIEWAEVQLADLVFGVSGSSGSGTSAAIAAMYGGSSSSSSNTYGMLSNLVSIGKGIYSWLTGGAATFIGMGGITSASYGVGSIAAGTLGATYGGVLGTGAVVTGAATTVAEALSAIAAAAPYAAAAVAAISILMSIADNQMKKDARGYMSLSAGLSDQEDALFDVFEATYGTSGFSEADAQKEIERITKDVGNTFSMYEEIWSYLSKHSQKALKESLKEIDWENIKLHFFTIATEGAPFYSHYEKMFDLDELLTDEALATITSGLTEAFGGKAYNDLISAIMGETGNWTSVGDVLTGIISVLDLSPELIEAIEGSYALYMGEGLADMITAALGYTKSSLTSAELAEVVATWISDTLNSLAEDGILSISVGTFTGTGAIHDILASYFTDYVEEGLANMSASDIYQYMSDDVKSNFEKLTAELFADDIEAFYAIYAESAAKLAKAGRIWETLKNIGEGYEYSYVDKLSAMASAWGEAYAATMEASGEELSDEDLAALVKEYYKALASGATDIDRAIMGVTELDVAVGALNGVFDAYIQQLKDLGVEVEEITELEEMRQAAMSKLLDDYKHSLGLISDEDYYTAMIEKIMETYKDYFGSAEEVIEAFKNASLADIQAFAEALGLDWTDIANDVGWLVQAIQALGTAATEVGSDIESIADEIRDILDGVRAKITGSTIGDTIAGLRTQFTGLQESLDKAWNEKRLSPEAGMAGLMEMAEILAEWYDASLQELEEAAQQAYETERTRIQGELDEKREQLNVIQAMSQLVDQIEDLIQSITYSSLNVAPPMEKAEEAQQDWATMVQEARQAYQSGDIEKAGELYQDMTGFAQTALQQYQNEYMSSAAYRTFYQQVMDDLEEAAGYAGEQQTAEEELTAAIESLEEELSNLSVEINAEDLAALNSEFESLAHWIEEGINTLTVYQEQFEVAGQVQGIFTQINELLQGGLTESEEETVQGLLQQVQGLAAAYGIFDISTLLAAMQNFGYALDMTSQEAYELYWGRVGMGGSWGAGVESGMADSMDEVVEVLQWILRFVAGIAQNTKGMAAAMNAEHITVGTLATGLPDSLASLMENWTVVPGGDSPFTGGTVSIDGTVDVNIASASNFDSAVVINPSEGFANGLNAHFAKNESYLASIKAYTSRIKTITDVNIASASNAASAVVINPSEGFANGLNAHFSAVENYLADIKTNTGTTSSMSVSVSNWPSRQKVDINNVSTDKGLTAIPNVAFGKALAAIANHTLASWKNLQSLVQYGTGKGAAYVYGLPYDAVRGYYQNLSGFPFRQGVYAEGGIITSPTLGLIGEERYPEAVIPMKDGINIPVKWINGGSTQDGSNGRPMTIIVQVGNQEFEGYIDGRARKEAETVRVNLVRRGQLTNPRRQPV